MTTPSWRFLEHPARLFHHHTLRPRLTPQRHPKVHPLSHRFPVLAFHLYLLSKILPQISPFVAYPSANPTRTVASNQRFHHDHRLVTKPCTSGNIIHGMTRPSANTKAATSAILQFFILLLLRRASPGVNPTRLEVWRQLGEALPRPLF